MLGEEQRVKWKWTVKDKDMIHIWMEWLDQGEDEVRWVFFDRFVDEAHIISFKTVFALFYSP